MKRLTIGKVAQQAGVNVETVRFYQRKGLVERPVPKSTSFREYPSGTCERIVFIKRAQTLGFTLKEIAELLSLADNPSGKRSEVRALAEKKLNAIREKLLDLGRMEQTLSALVGKCSGRGRISGCPIIDAITSPQEDEPTKGAQDCEGNH